MTVAFKELAGSPTETYGPRGMKAVRRVLCAWENYRALIGELLSNSYLSGDFTLSAPYPGYDQVVAAQVKVEPFQANPNESSGFTDITANLNSYTGQFALLTITYDLLVLVGSKDRMPTPQQGTFLTYRMDFSSQTVVMPGYSLHWENVADAPIPPETNPILRVPMIEHHISWHRVDNPPWTAIRACIGCVNRSTFLGAPADTVLFDGATAGKEFVSLGDLSEPQYSWKLTYVFKEKSLKYSGDPYAIYGWNDSYRSLPRVTPGFDRLLDSNDSPLYAEVDFSNLFLFEPSS